MIDMLGWLVLAAVAASGWWWARHSASSGERLPSSWPTPYFEGLNYLLNEEQDKAVAVFIKMLEVNAETVEIHLALGHLFRRRGEVDRAIRLHQNLSARQSLSPQHRDQALYELAQDFLSAGLFDRAEKLFLNLKSSPYCGTQSLNCLVDLYEREREWASAIATLRELGRAGGDRQRVLMAQYFCELADIARTGGDLPQALHLAEQALDVNKNCVRASLLMGEVERALGHPAKAIKALQRIEKQDPDFLDESVAPLLSCYEALDESEQAQKHLLHLYERFGNYQALLAITRMFEKQHGGEEAQRMLVARLQTQPSVMGLQRLVELLMVQRETPATALPLIKQLLDRLAEESITYVCGDCGFGGKCIFWQCPGCRRWENIRPRWAFPNAKGV